METEDSSLARRFSFLFSKQMMVAYNKVIGGRLERHAQNSRYI